MTSNLRQTTNLSLGSKSLKSSGIPGLDLTSTDSKDLSELLLYGTSDLNTVDNRMSFEATISFPERSRDFDCN